MTKEHKLIQAALQGFTSVQKSEAIPESLPKFNANSCNSKGGCGSKK